MANFLIIKRSYARDFVLFIAKSSQRNQIDNVNKHAYVVLDQLRGAKKSFRYTHLRSYESNVFKSNYHSHRLYKDIAPISDCLHFHCRLNFWANDIHML